MNRGRSAVSASPSSCCMLVLVGQLTYLQVDRRRQPRRTTRATSARALRDANRPRGPIVTADGVVLAVSKPVDDGTEFKYQREYPLGGAVQPGRRLPVVRRRQHRRRADVQRRARRPRRRAPDREHPRHRRRQGGGRHGRPLDAGRHAARRRRRTGLPARAPSSRSNPRPARSSRCTRTLRSTRSPLAGHDAKEVQRYFTALSADPAKPDLPRAYRERYPPGSTFKAVTTSVGLDDRRHRTRTRSTRSSPSSTCRSPTTRSQNFGGRRCGGTLDESFVQSCNTTFGADRPRPRRPVPAGHGALRDRRRAAARHRPGRGREHRAASRQFQDNQPLFAFAGIGQGDVATTPLQMALVAAARRRTAAS